MLVRRLTVFTVSLAVAGAVFAVPDSVQADPPLSIAEAKEQIATLESDAAALDQSYVAVQEQLTAGRKEWKLKQADVKAQTAKVARMRAQVSEVALAQFQGGNLDTTAQLFLTSDTDGFLNQISTVEKISDNQNSVLQEFQGQQGELAELERSAATDLQSLTDQEKSLARLRTASEAKLAEAKTVLTRLTEQERRRLAAEEAAARAAARKAAEAALRASRQSSRPGPSRARDTSRPTPRNTPAPKASSGSSRGVRALAFARGEIGTPYRFASAGPSAYDCSGLTYAAWRTVGVTLPRTSQAQFRVGRSVARSDLQPGDLVFFYSGLSHVGIYVGNGTMVHSPRSGRSVEYSSISTMPFAGARRPG